MNLQYKNLVVDFSYSAEEGFGTYELVIPYQSMKKFLADNCWDENTLPEYSADEVYEWLLNEPEEKIEFICRDSDLGILFMDWVLEYCEEDVKVAWYGTTPMWLCHDLSHALNDVAAGTVYSDYNIETRAVMDSMDIAKTMGILTCINAEMFLRFEEEFTNRWKKPFDWMLALNKLNELIA